MRNRIIVGSAIAAASWLAFVATRQWWKTWGVVPDEATKPLPGDDLVPDAQASDTRGITIEAAPDRVWPWLVQMGYERGGWYSIDQLDMRAKSANRIVEEWQGLAVGDILPTYPGGGFQVKALDPNRSLVLYGDTSTMQPASEAEQEEMPAGLAASSTFLVQTPSEFKASWAFVLEQAGPNRTRLIERMRYWGGEGTPASRAALSMLGFGAFVMMQRQMVGIRSRAEQLAVEKGMPPIPAAESGDNGHAADVPETVLASAE
jgi:proline iminopeptidase